MSLKNRINRNVNNVLKKMGVHLKRFPERDLITDQKFIEIYNKCKPFTMTSVEKMYALYSAVNYLNRSGVAGDIVECGVWKGGSSMLSAFTQLSLNNIARDLYLYDTYEGMSVPSEKDIAIFSGQKNKQAHLSNDFTGDWLKASLESVKVNMSSTNYPMEKIIYVKGKVEDTIPNQIPSQIALLRLDTDWYESTLWELEHLYPRLVEGGVLLLDDYRFWGGSKDATDEYFNGLGISPFLQRIDRGGAMMVKPISLKK